MDFALKLSEMLRAGTNPDLFPLPQKMKGIGQIANVELTVLSNHYTVAFAKTRLAINPPPLLARLEPLVTQLFQPWKKS